MNPIIYGTICIGTPVIPLLDNNDGIDGSEIPVLLTIEQTGYFYIEGPRGANYFFDVPRGGYKGFYCLKHDIMVI